MQSGEKFSFLRKIIKAFGLSDEAADDIISRIEDLLSEKGDKSHSQLQVPYFIRDDFFSAAEQSFFLVLQSAVGGAALVFPKVGLGELFYAKSSDPSHYRTATNRIDRKHVDFLLCDPKTLRPLVGIELDDKSHQRADRQVRDKFVDAVFRMAKLPILRIPAKRGYAVGEISALVSTYLPCPPKPGPSAPPAVLVTAVSNGVQASAVSQPVAVAVKESAAPACPICGGEMVLRTAKNGSKPGSRFWGCRDFPRCRGIVPAER